MNEIPSPVLNVAGGALATCAVALVFWSIRQVRSAARVVSNDATLRQTVADQAALIIAQQLRINDLERCAKERDKKVADLEAIVRQAQLLEEIRPAKRVPAMHPPMAGE